MWGCGELTACLTRLQQAYVMVYAYLSQGRCADLCVHSHRCLKRCGQTREFSNIKAQILAG